MIRNWCKKVQVNLKVCFSMNTKVRKLCFLIAQFSHHQKQSLCSSDCAVFFFNNDQPSINKQRESSIKSVVELHFCTQQDFIRPLSSFFCLSYFCVQASGAESVCAYFFAVNLHHFATVFGKFLDKSCKQSHYYCPNN